MVQYLRRRHEHSSTTRLIQLGIKDRLDGIVGFFGKDHFDLWAIVRSVDQVATFFVASNIISILPCARMDDGGLLKRVPSWMVFAWGQQMRAVARLWLGIFRVLTRHPRSPTSLQICWVSTTNRWGVEKRTVVFGLEEIRGRNWCWIKLGSYRYGIASIPRTTTMDSRPHLTKRENVYDTAVCVTQ